MFQFRANGRLTTWIAALAILIASLAPSLSHAFGAAQPASWIEVCSEQGSRWIVDNADDSAPAAGHVFEHCAYCSTHATTMGLPPSPEGLPLPIDGDDEFPAAFLGAAPTLHAWLSARPRAPPQRS